MRFAAHHHALLLAANAVAKVSEPGFQYAEFDGSALVFPNSLGTFQTLAFCLNGPARIAHAGAYLIDKRPNGDGYVYGQDVKNIRAWVNGAPITDYASLSDFYTNADVRVVLECSDFLSPTMLSRYTQDGAGTPDNTPIRLWQMAAYNRVFTAAEKASTSGAWPADGLLGAWDFKQMNDSSIPDISGHGHHISVIGLPGTTH